MRRVATDEATAWLREAASPPRNDGYTGFNVDVWSTSTWILNAMYESETSLPDISWDELLKQRLRSGEAKPHIINGVSLEERTTATGISLGRSQAPGQGWHRLLWSELAKRERAPMADSGVPPCYRWFSHGSWPIRIRPFAERSLDRESFLRLVEILLRQPDTPPDGRIWCYYSPLAAGDLALEAAIVLDATLAELPEIYDFPEVTGSPTNIWPHDRSWFVYTDSDLSGTRVSGSEELVASIVADDGLETTSYP